jgi:hypothetical protein
MDNLEIIDELNKHKLKKFLQIDKQPKADEYYVAYTKKPKEYIKLAHTGKKELYFANNRPFPIFQGFVNGKTCVILVSAARGTGKGIFGCGIAEDYHKLNKTNNIYYVCSTGKKLDENMSKLSYVKDFDIGELNNFQILNAKPTEEITDENKDAGDLLDNYKDSLFIFDDVDELSKNVKQKINMLEKICISLGRKKGISVCKISHYETNGHETRLILKELDYYITFNSDVLQTNRLLTNYRKTDLTQFLNEETYLIFNFKYGYCITNKRILMLK